MNAGVRHPVARAGQRAELREGNLFNHVSRAVCLNYTLRELWCDSPSTYSSALHGGHAKCTWMMQNMYVQPRDHSGTARQAKNECATR